jgi:hypothetical protein
MKFEKDNRVIEQYAKELENYKVIYKKQEKEWIKFVVKAFQCYVYTKQLPTVNGITLTMPFETEIYAYKKVGILKKREYITKFHWFLDPGRWGHVASEDIKKYLHNFDFVCKEVDNGFFKFEVSSEFELVAPIMWEYMKVDVDEALMKKMANMTVQKICFNL